MFLLYPLAYTHMFFLWRVMRALVVAMTCIFISSLCLLTYRGCQLWYYHPLGHVEAWLRQSRQSCSSSSSSITRAKALLLDSQLNIVLLWILSSSNVYWILTTQPTMKTYILQDQAFIEFFVLGWQSWWLLCGF